MFVLPDVDDIFVPVCAAAAAAAARAKAVGWWRRGGAVQAPSDLLVVLEESRAQVLALLSALPIIHANSQNVESAVGPAIETASQLMTEVCAPAALCKGSRANCSSASPASH